MKRLTRDELVALVGLRAADKLLKAHPALWVADTPEGDVVQPVDWRVREPWDREGVQVLLSGAWVTLPVAYAARRPAEMAMAQAKLEGRSLGVRIVDGTIMEIWVV